ncbi:DUF2530 domain-containing protein [Streptomyces sp. ACA25]|uniref:DUF2530 domain-containing protein n=1 Tax=Streptomyces sp. ACA25 TaxID=3022596 RepID=UPI002307CB89|nr:DUF2530 domain-containing protein [Streptomyces sp. ACA25]MDB1088141.1 DUF2530 domain-containing protein [Streptomyces sp. ACA25]
MRWAELANGKREAPEPLEGNITAAVAAGTGIWALLFLGQLPFYGWYAEHGHEWWIWSCLVGTGLGLFGLWYAKRHGPASTSAEPQAPSPGPDSTTESGADGSDGSGGD